MAPNCDDCEVPDAACDRRLLGGGGRDGMVRLVRASFLAELWRRGDALPARRALPEHAFVDATELDHVIIVALSYRWAGRSHPDPHGALLALFAPLLERFSGEQQCEVAVFWDWASVAEPSDAAVTRACLSLLAHRQTLVWFCAAQPNEREQILAKKAARRSKDGRSAPADYLARRAGRRPRPAGAAAAAAAAAAGVLPPGWQEAVASDGRPTITMHRRERRGGTLRRAAAARPRRARVGDGARAGGGRGGVARFPRPRLAVCRAARRIAHGGRRPAAL